MKNASFLCFCCILLIIILSIFIKQYNTSYNENALIFKVHDVTNDNIFEMPLEEYVWRVTAKEMPLSFHDEAIKAQMVAARTYAIRKMSANAHDNNADVCTDHNHCTAFLLPGEEKTKLGADYKTHCNRLKTLNKPTQNQILTFENQPILAAFHAISSGKTEKSSDVWQTQLPYLISVDSSVDKNVDGFATSTSYTETELKDIFNTNTPINFEIVSYTDSGSVKNIKINDKTYSGVQVRKLLNLKSCNFSIENKGNIYTFHVKGYGHGVGMSQTGANEYAKLGISYKEILLKYYPGTDLTDINNLSFALKTTK